MPGTSDPETTTPTEPAMAAAPISEALRMELAAVEELIDSGEPRQARRELREAVLGTVDVEGTAPMTRDSIVRFASITKPIVAAAVLQLIEDGRLGLEDPVARWLPELAEPVVVRTPDAALDDVVAADRPITVHDVLSSRAGYGFASDFSLPAVREIFTVQPDGRRPRSGVPVDEWMAALARIPLAHQPGDGWFYNTCSELQGVLIARVTGRSLPDVLAERLFEPLGMRDTGFVVPAAQRHRLTSYYLLEDGRPELADGPDGVWSEPPVFPSGAGGLAGTADDWLAFARMLLAGGAAAGGGRVLSAESVELMTTDHTTAAQRAMGELFLEGQGWGFGGSVDRADAREPADPWVVPGRYGWVGGFGTSAHVIPSSGRAGILLTQVAMDDPVAPRLMRDFWTYTARG